ncbi:hypothetical protein NP493_285g02000 [Ridgeia piscesae]|uniref:ABC-type xenobiotic transporter n=1 Tax=Ridgeia piscesae TaxID=27915 RepID=A0AAD9UCB5_RIDPI|nr:hypothetical protein NP493_285g02000 [Ridgeia piscesae]
MEARSSELLTEDEKTPSYFTMEILPAKDRGPEDNADMVPLRRVFRYADCRDILLMIVGTVGAILHGAFYILSNVVLGLQMDAFLIYEKGNRYLLDFPDVWKRYDVTIHDLWENKSMIDLIGVMENRTDISSSHISADLNPDIFFDEMKLYTYWYVGMAGGVMIFAFCQVSLWAVAAERQVRRIRIHFLRAVLRQDIGWYDRLGSGELNTRLSDDMHKIVDGIGEKFSSAIELFACFILAFIQGFFIGWKLSLVMLVIVPVLITAALITSSVSTKLTNEELKSYAKAGKVAEEVIGSIRTVAAFGGETKEAERYNNNLSEARDKGIRKGLILGLSMGGTWFVVYAAYSLGFWYGAKLIREDDSYTPGRLLIVFFSILTGAVAIGLAGPKIQAVAVARGAADTIFKIIDREPDIDSSSETGVRPENISGNIEFRNVLFRYPTRPDVPVLNGLNLKVKVGQTVALVGASGCGKSTTVALLQRFYDPLAGSVLVDGIDIRDYNLKHLRQHVGVVGQEPILFGMSIIENIRFGRENVTDAEVIEATKQANAYNFIMKLPETFETMVGDRGAQLSGGQKQRIAIARALVRNPTILLLDEATSALDTESESTVQAALDTASHGRTTIVIAHRLSTVRNADKICSFHDGEIVEEGNHAELMKKGRHLR